MDITEVSLFFVTAVTLYGNYLISEGKKFGFILGLITNMIFFCTDLFNGLPSHALLFIVNALLSWNGLRKWKSHPST